MAQNGSIAIGLCAVKNLNYVCPVIFFGWSFGLLNTMRLLIFPFFGSWSAVCHTQIKLDAIHEHTYTVWTLFDSVTYARTSKTRPAVRKRTKSGYPEWSMQLIQFRSELVVDILDVLSLALSRSILTHMYMYIVFASELCTQTILSTMWIEHSSFSWKIVTMRKGDGLFLSSDIPTLSILYGMIFGRKYFLANHGDNDSVNHLQRTFLSRVCGHFSGLF